MKPLKTLDYAEINAKTVFVRMDLNVPMAQGKVLDTTRIEAALPTLKRLLAAGSNIIVGSHLGRPSTANDPAFSLAPVGELLSERLTTEVILVEDSTSQPPSTLFKLIKPTSLILLENLRFVPAETSADDHERRIFARHLSQGVDLYVFEAFGVAHRKHSSVFELPQWLGFEHCVAGLHLAKEYQALHAVTTMATKPFALVMGGAKIADKLGAILGLLTVIDELIIGGAMAMPLLKALNIPTGDHVITQQELHYANLVLRNAAQHNITVHLPKDHILAQTFQAAAQPTISSTAAIPNGYLGLDIGPKTCEAFTEALANKQTIVWNGPMGVYEWSSFQHGSTHLAHTIATHSAHTIVGGGDSLALLQAAKLSSHISHLSTGGGAMLEFFNNPRLPGLKALWSSSQL